VGQNNRFAGQRSCGSSFNEGFIYDARLANQDYKLEKANYHKQATKNPGSLVSPILDRLNAYSRYRTNPYGLFFIVGCYIVTCLDLLSQS
jgi:hypothetical protein